MTSPRDETRYTFKVDERDASRGLKKLAEGMEDVDKLSAKLRKSQSLQADAAGKLRVAESRLTDLRQTGKAKASQLAQAEESVAAARRKLVGASDDARRSSLALGRAQESNRRTSLLAARAQEGTRQATTSLSRVQDGAVGSSGRLRRATGSTITGFVSARKSVGGLSVGIGSLLGPVGLMAGAATAAGLAFAGVFVAGLKGFVDEARESQKVGRLTTAVIKSTGGAAKVSATQVGDLAESISNKIGVDDEAVQSAENLLLTFTKVRNEAGKGNDIFNQATFAVADMAAAMNGGVVTAEGMRSTTVRLGKALQDPVKGITALSKAGVVFTDQQKTQIKTLVESGHTLEAQKVILAELRKEFGGAAAAGADPIMRMQVAWANFKETVGLAVLPVVERLSAYLADKLPGAAQKTASFVTATFVPALAGISEGFRHVREQVGPVSLGLASFNSGVRDMGAAASGVAATVAPIGDVLTKVKIGGDGAGKALGPIGDLLIGLGGSAGGATAALEPMGDLLKTNNRGAEEFGKKVGAALRTLVDWSFKGAIGLVHLGEQGALGLASILEGFASVSIGMGNFLKDTYGTLTGVLGGFKILAKAIAPALVPKIEESERAMREFGQKAGQSMVDSGNKAKGMADTIRRNVPPAAAAAKAKLEDMRKSALGIPKSTLTRLDVAERTAQQKIAATKRQLQDPALTATRKAKLEADLRKWQAQLAQIQRDKARAAQAVRIPTGATAMPSRVIVVREKDKNGIVTGIRFAGRGAFATGGRVFGAGTETSDSIPARLSKGEHVWTAREVRGAGGHSAVERMRKQAARAPGYATGGMVRAEDGSLVPASFYNTPSGMVRAEDGSLVPKSFYGPIPLGYAKTRAQTRSGLKSAADAGLRAAVMSVMRDALKREGFGAFNAGLAGALSFARSQVGDPYVWGGVGPNGFDCSGFQSAITNVAKGRRAYRRLFATGSFPTSEFARGPGAYMIGSTTDTGGGIGHMAGTLNGVNVESRGGDGVVVGPRARGARAGLFGGNTWHLKGFAAGGPVGDIVRWGSVSQSRWSQLLAAGWRGRAGDRMEALYRPARSWVTGGDGSRAKMLRSHINHGGRFFEDFSYRGASPFYRRGNDRLAAHFWAGHRGFNFGGPRTHPVVGSWLNSVITQAIYGIRQRRLAEGGPVGDPPFDLLSRRGKHYQAELAEMLMAAKVADRGAWLAPNSTTVVKNGTSQWEPVGPPGPQRLHPADIQALGEVIGRVVVGGIRSNDVAVGRTADLILRGG